MLPSPITTRVFQSPQPMQAATVGNEVAQLAERFSIPAAYAGCDAELKYHYDLSELISIPAAYAGCDAVDVPVRSLDAISIPAAYAGSDGQADRTPGTCAMISIPAAYAGCDGHGRWGETCVCGQIKVDTFGIGFST